MANYNNVIGFFLLGIKSGYIIDTELFNNWLNESNYSSESNWIIPCDNKDEIYHQLEKIIGWEQIPQASVRAYLSFAKDKFDSFYKFPKEEELNNKTSLYIHLRSLTESLNDKTDFELIDANYSNDLLAYNTDDELLNHFESKRASQIFGQFSFLLALYDGFTLDNCENWDYLNAIVDNKINYLKNTGNKISDFGSPQEVYNKSINKPDFFKPGIYIQR